MPISQTDLILNPDGSIYHLNLLPEHIAETIITVGDPDRVAHVSDHFDVVDEKIHKREFVTHVGYIRKKKVTVISTGIGTDNIDIVLNELDALVNIDLNTREPKPNTRKLNIIRIGTSGALQENITVGSHLATDYAVGFDNLMSFYPLEVDDFEATLSNDIREKFTLRFSPYVVRGSALLRRQFGRQMISGNTVTCPGFYGPQGRNLRKEGAFPNLVKQFQDYHSQILDFRLTNFEMETAGYYGLGRLLGHEILSVNAIIANRVKSEFAADPHAVVDTLIKKVLENI
ncbi:MAG TPA: nucleoside phosphorylase [Chryseosolibacter sp.]|nr:nucleoside phosphorylase [Chryseosolibacter sp.]